MSLMKHAGQPRVQSLWHFMLGPVRVKHHERREVGVPQVPHRLAARIRREKGCHMRHAVETRGTFDGQCPGQQVRAPGASVRASRPRPRWTCAAPHWASGGRGAPVPCRCRGRRRCRPPASARCSAARTCNMPCPPASPSARFWKLCFIPVELVAGAVVSACAARRRAEGCWACATMAGLAGSTTTLYLGRWRRAHVWPVGSMTGSRRSLREMGQKKAPGAPASCAAVSMSPFVKLPAHAHAPCPITSRGPHACMLTHAMSDPHADGVCRRRDGAMLEPILFETPCCARPDTDLSGMSAQGRGLARTRCQDGVAAARPLVPADVAQPLARERLVPPRLAHEVPVQARVPCKVHVAVPA